MPYSGQHGHHIHLIHRQYMQAKHLYTYKMKKYRYEIMCVHTQFKWSHTMWDDNALPKNRPCNRTPVPGMRNLLLQVQEIPSSKQQRIFPLPLVIPQNLAAKEGSVAEDTVYFGHRTWRNYLELTLEASFMRTGSHSIGGAVQTAEGKSYQYSHPAVVYEPWQ